MSVRTKHVDFAMLLNSTGIYHVMSVRTLLFSHRIPQRTCQAVSVTTQVCVSVRTLQDITLLMSVRTLPFSHKMLVKLISRDCASRSKWFLLWNFPVTRWKVSTVETITPC